MEISVSSRDVENFIEFLPVGVLVFDGTMRISLWNDLALTLLGIGVETVLSGEFAGNIDEELLKLVVEADRKVTAGQQRLMVEKNGRSLNCTIKNIASEEGSRTIMLVEDATKFKHVEMIQRDFITNVLQKLRGPLSTLKTSLSMVQSEKVLENSAQTGEILAMGYHEVNRLVDLVNDLRDLFLIETGLAQKDSDMEEFPASAAFDRAVEEIGKMPAPFSNVRQRLFLTGDQHRRVRADFTKTKKIFTVLLKNAILYSDITSPIEASFSSIDDCVAVCVKDKGPGIKEKNIPFVFEKYFREDTAATRKNEGNGLGLFIAKSYADLMGGSLCCESVEGRGSTFFVSLPIPRSK